MSTNVCVTVIAGILEDHVFNHICFIAEGLSTILPNFYHKTIYKSSTEWKSWLQKTCALHSWSHTKSPLIWREIGITQSYVNYVGGSHQFWELLHRYYNIESHLTREDLEALQADLLFAHDVKGEKSKKTDVQEDRRRITIIGAGRSVCPDLVCQLLMMKELWLSHGIVISLYDEPGCFFKLKRMFKDAGGVGAGLNTVITLDSVSQGLKDCHILIYLDALLREEYEGTDDLLKRNYKDIEKLSMEINEYAPTYMKVVLCSMGFTCLYANIMHELVTKIPSTSIVAVSSHYGLELVYPLVNSLGYTLQNFGCPPVWGYLGINHFVDVDRMLQKCHIHPSNVQTSHKTVTLPIRTQQHSELRWFFYMSHVKKPYVENLQRKALTQYLVGRSEDFPKCKAICDLLKLWYSEGTNIGDEIISLGIASDGSFGIPSGLVFSQPVYLKVSEDRSRIWIPFKDFPMPNMPISIFQNFIDTAMIINERVAKLRENSS